MEIDLGLHAPTGSGTYSIPFTVNTVSASGTRSYYSTVTQNITVRAQGLLSATIAGDISALSLSSYADRSARTRALVEVTAGLAKYGQGLYLDAVAQYLAAADDLRAIRGADAQTPLTELARLLKQAELAQCGTLPQCSAITPSVIGAKLFTAYGDYEGLEARGGRSGAAYWEWGLGANTSASGSFVSQNQDWVNGKVYGWTLTYDGAGNGSITVKDNASNAPLFTRSYPGGSAHPLRAGNALRFSAQSNSCGDDAQAQVVATINSLKGQATSLSLATPAMGSDQDDDDVHGASQVLFLPAMASGFTAQGTLKFLYRGSRPPADRGMTFTVNAGNAVCR